MDWKTLAVPGVIPLTWLSYAHERGLVHDDLTKRLGITEKFDPTSFSTGLEAKDFIRLALEIINRTGDNGVGFEIGWRLPLTAYGPLGQAMMASPTAGDALAVCLRFWQLIARGLRPETAVQQDTFVFTLAPYYPLEGPLGHIMTESTAASVFRAMVLLIPAAASEIEVWVDSPEPPYAENIRRHIPKIRFDMPILAFRFPKSLLDVQLPMASPPALAAAIENCEAELSRIDTHGKFTLKVQQNLKFRSSGYFTLEEMAEHLALTPRTLRRHLASEGGSYSALLQAARRRDALQLLDNPSLEVADVAERLGYYDSANFVRAFRKLTGLSPTEYRRRANIEAT
ncbi:AraC family transcriptional regulator [Oleomonas cavernae]|uniref:AraC family transcriptional regulator n=1 Tax=Oleomonas cavernae TaxID=2320859 RepID=A0A418WH06_9PROT|nr:AraC family transcriptional regulator [Oleomonas cavernae]RJF89321.1 AraC family transcriptional regulator [Oleomonas cavernae]